MSKKIAFLIFLFSGLCFSQNTDLPLYPVPGGCYVKCEVEEGNYKWRDIECYLIYYNELRVNIDPDMTEISKRDKKIIDRKIVKLTKKKFAVSIEVHHDSKETDSVNLVLSNRKAQLLAGYLDSLKIPRQMVWITSFGNIKAKSKCVDSTKNCNKLHETNSKIKYRVLSAGKPSQESEYRYDEKLGFYYYCIIPKE